MKGKNKFLISSTYLNVMENLTDEEIGKIFLQVLRYVNDLNPDPLKERHLQLLFEVIKGELKSDLKSWKDKCEILGSNGKKGGRPKKETNDNE